MCLYSGTKEKTNEHKHFGRTVFGTNRNRPWDKRGPVPGTNRDLFLGQTGRFVLNSTANSPFCPGCPWDGQGSSLGQLSCKGRPEKWLYVLCLFVFCSPPMYGPWQRGWKPPNPNIPLSLSLSLSRLIFLSLFDLHCIATLSCLCAWVQRLALAQACALCC